MPSNVIDGPEDEKKWQRAKENMDPDGIEKSAIWRRAVDNGPVD